MTIGTALSSVLYQIGIEVITPQITDPDYNIAQVRAFMDDAGRDISKRAEWSKLYRSHSIPGSVSESVLPSDFYKLGESGSVMRNGASYEPMRNAPFPEMWQMLTKRNSGQPYFILREGRIQFSPALTADGAIVRYVSSSWLDTNSDTITDNSDGLLIPERLLVSATVWRWKRQKGLPYDDHLAEFEAELVADIKSDRGIQ